MRLTYVGNISSYSKGGDGEELQYAEVKIRQRLSRDGQAKAETSAGPHRPHREEQVEYGEFKIAERLTGPDGAPRGSEQVEYGEFKILERPRQNDRPMGPDGAQQGSEQVEYGQIKFSERPWEVR